MLLADILFKQASFLGFANSYNFLNSANFKSRYSLDSRILAEVFYMYQILKFKIEFNIQEITESKKIFVNLHIRFNKIYNIIAGMVNEGGEVDEILAVIKSKIFPLFVKR